MTTIKSVRNSGFNMRFPNGCFEIQFAFEPGQGDPNVNWGVAGNAKDYQGVRDMSKPVGQEYVTCIAYFDGHPTFNGQPVTVGMITHT